MKMSPNKTSFIFLLSICFLIETALSTSDICDLFKQEQCPFLPGNIVGTISNLQSAQECQKECQAPSMTACQYFTYYAFSDQPTECYLFKSCDATTPCDDCISGPKTPDLPDECVVDCSLFQTGRCDLAIDDILDIQDPVASPSDCQVSCRSTASCTMFSYDSISQICYLFAQCSIMDSCSSCSSGPPYPDIDICQVTTPAPTTQPAATMALAVGGFSRRDGINYVLGSTEIFSLHKTCSIHVWEMDDWTEMMVEVVNGSPMACGGYDRTRAGYYNKCWLLDFQTGQWTLLQGLLPVPVHLASSVPFRSSMMIFGGSNGHYGPWTQEYFAGNDTWLYRSEMNMPESKGHHCAVNVHDELIFLFGGYYSSSLDSSHVLNYTKGTWTELPSMHDARHQHTCQLYNHRGKEGILVVGGQCVGGNCDVVGPLKSVEFFDFEKIRWETLYDSFLQEPRYTHGMSLMDGIPVVYGGRRNETEFLTSGEKLVGETWVKIEDVLTSSRAAFGYTDIPADIIDC